MRIAARAPNHLGDGVVALPALRALAAQGSLRIYAPRWGSDLYRDLGAEVQPRGWMSPADVAVLFPPSLRAALQAVGSRRRVGTRTDARGWLITDPIPNDPRTPARYAALAATVGAIASGTPEWAVRSDDRAADVPADHLGLVPISASGAVREWGGYRALADRSERPVVFYGGPGEEAAVARIAGPHRQVVGQPLPELAATLQRCAVLVGNDSGASHFARAVGVPVVAVFGSTIAAWTGAAGARAVEGPALPCRPCYGRVCRVGDLACLRIDVAAVEAAIDEVARG